MNLILEQIKKRSELIRISVTNELAYLYQASNTKQPLLLCYDKNKKDLQVIVNYVGVKNRDYKKIVSVRKREQLTLIMLHDALCKSNVVKLLVV